MKKLVQLSLLAVLIPALCHAKEDISHQAKGERSGITTLSPELRELFSREMIELQNGMMEIIPLYVAGNLDEISTIARKMESSYVLKQNLSKSQVHELHSKLSGSFIELDQQFHYLAGMLEHVASMRKIELVGFYISKMNETCVRCHTEYATHRFPALAPKSRDGHSH